MVAISMSERMVEPMSVSFPDARSPGKVSGVFFLIERDKLYLIQESGIHKT